MDCTDKDWRTALILGLLCSITITTFLPLLSHDFLQYDDPQYVTANPHVLSGLSLTNVKWAFHSLYFYNWHPLTWLSHMLDVQLFGLRPGWHHLTNLLLHTANTLLVWLFLSQTTHLPWRSALVAALFAVHPLHVESVAWVAERKDVLSTFFALLALCAYSSYVKVVTRPKSDLPSQPSSAPNSPGGLVMRCARQFREGLAQPVFHSGAWYGLSLGFFILSLLSKPMLVTFPFLLLLLDFWPFRRMPSPLTIAAVLARKSNLKWLILEKAPFLALAVALTFVTFRAMAGSHGVMSSLPFGSRLSNAMLSYWVYLGKMFWPERLAIFYPHPDLRLLHQSLRSPYPVSALLNAPFIVAVLLLIVACYLAVLRRNREPWFTAGWFWYVGLLVPVIGLVQAGGHGMADRYTYLPLIGVFVVLVWGSSELLGRISKGPAILAAGSLAVLAACIFVTRHQLGFWRDNDAVFEHALAVTTHNPVAECFVGLGLAQKGQCDRALTHFRAALEADPSYAEAYCGLGYVSELTQQRQDAISQYESALRIEPWLDGVHDRLGMLYGQLGRKDESFNQYAEAIRFNPDNPEAQYHYGTALLRMGHPEEASLHLGRAVQLKPAFPEALDLLAALQFQQGRLAEAEASFRALVGLCPTNTEARINLGGVLWRLGWQPQALDQYREAVRLDPNHPVGQYNLAFALAARGDRDEAATHYTEALRLKPDYPEAHRSFGLLLLQEGRTEAAIIHLREAVRLKPGWQMALEDLSRALALQSKTAAEAPPPK